MDLDPAPHTVFQEPIARILGAGLSRHRGLDAVDGIQDREQRGTGKAIHRSEHANDRTLDAIAQKRMQAVARGNIDIDAELLLQQNLDTREIEEGEFSGRIVLDENVDVALLARVAPRSRAEHVKRRCAERANGVPRFLQFGYGSGLVHVRSLSVVFPFG